MAEDTNTSLISKDISYIQRDISTINQNIKELTNVYATKIALDTLKVELADRLKRIEGSNNLWKFLAPTLSASFSAVVTFLLLAYLGK